MINRAESSLQYLTDINKIISDLNQLRIALIAQIEEILVRPAA